jgi:hypothetical protein
MADEILDIYVNTSKNMTKALLQARTRENILLDNKMNLMGKQKHHDDVVAKRKKKVFIHPLKLKRKDWWKSDIHFRDNIKRDLDTFTMKRYNDQIKNEQKTSTPVEFKSKFKEVSNEFTIGTVSKQTTSRDLKAQSMNCFNTNSNQSQMIDSLKSTSFRLPKIKNHSESLPNFQTNLEYSNSFIRKNRLSLSDDDLAYTNTLERFIKRKPVNIEIREKYMKQQMEEYNARKAKAKEYQRTKLRDSRYDNLLNVLVKA